MTTQRFPLAWPAGWKRTPVRQFAKFSTSRYVSYGDGQGGYRQRENLPLGQALTRLTGELSRLGVREGDFVISSDLRLRLDGFPRADQGNPSDPGVAVYFRLGKQDRVLACDRWTRIADNIAAIAAHIECLRGIDRYGVGTMEQAFAGYAALPPSPTDWRTVFELSAGATFEQVEARFRDLAKEHHPDRGGDPNAMARINVARDAARAELARQG